jgi:hypothetical protein
VSVKSARKESALPAIPDNKVTVATVHLRGISPISFGRLHETPPLSGDESKADWEQRTFRNKAHFLPGGESFLPQMAIKKSIQEAAAYLSLSIPGGNSAKYTKHFLSGILVLKPGMLSLDKESLKIADAREEVFHVSVRGNSKAGGSRVKRHFPTFDQWETTIEVHILDGVITEAIFERVLRAAGRFIGIGRFRPANGGFYGRFEVIDIQYETLIG